MDILKIQETSGKLSESLMELERILRYFYQQNYYQGTMKSKQFLDGLPNLMEDLFMDDSMNLLENKNGDLQEVISILNQLLKAQTEKDYILLADLYEILLKPYLIRIQEGIVMKYRSESVEIEDEHCQHRVFRIEYTSSGLPTVLVLENDTSYYLHSNYLVMREADEIAVVWYSSEVEEYIVYGLGLGYAIKALIDRNEYCKVRVYEGNSTIISIARSFGVYDQLINSGQVQIYEDFNYQLLSQALRDKTKDQIICIHSPSLRLIDDNRIKVQMENYFIEDFSIRNQLQNMNGNFRVNIHNFDASVEDLAPIFGGEDLYIVAAGPSLDRNYTELKNVKAHGGIVLATGTILHKLLNNGIEPDYVIITDSSAHTFSQVLGRTESKIPLLFLSTTYYKIPQQYAGKRYLICQRGYQRSEQFAKQRGYQTYQTGGSVITTALDVGIGLGCKRIVFVGLDLAFTDGRDHASDTNFVAKVEREQGRTTKDIYGNSVPTGKNLDIYREWLERRMKEAPDIEFIDATEGGAFIVGTKLMTLKDTIEMSNNKMKLIE